MCTTMPDLHVAVVGIDKVVPDWESLTVFLKLLARSATGQRLSTYTQFITGPRRAEGSSVRKNFIWSCSIMGVPKFSKIPLGGMCSNVFAVARARMFVLFIR